MTNQPQPRLLYLVPENKSLQLTGNFERESLPAMAAAAEEFRGVTIQVLPTETEEQALLAATTMDIIYRNDERTSVLASNGCGRIAVAAMAVHMFEDREKIAPVIITMSRSDFTDLSPYWDRVDQLNKEAKA